MTVTNNSIVDLKKKSIYLTKNSNYFLHTRKVDPKTLMIFYSEDVCKGFDAVTIQLNFEELDMMNGENLYNTAEVEFGFGKNKRELSI